jgi:hypothetical protein
MRKKGGRRMWMGMQENEEGRPPCRAQRGTNREVSLREGKGPSKGPEGQRPGKGRLWSIGNKKKQSKIV